jgi:hypothetical protein
MTHRYLIAFCFLSGEIVTPTAEDYAEGYPAPTASSRLMM